MYIKQQENVEDSMTGLLSSQGQSSRSSNTILNRSCQCVLVYKIPRLDTQRQFKCKNDGHHQNISHSC